MKVDHVIGRFIIPVIILYCIYCNKSNDVSSSQTNSSAVTIADILSCQIVGMHPQICIISPYVNIMFADSVTNPGDLVASFSLSSGAHANLNGIAQVSGITQNNFENALNYNVTNASGVTKSWEIIGTHNNYTANWGLGQWLQKSVKAWKLVKTNKLKAA